MLADFFTKPLQANPFHKFCNAIMNNDPRLMPIMDHRSVLGSETQTHTNKEIRLTSNNSWMTVTGKPNGICMVNTYNSTKTGKVSGITNMAMLLRSKWAKDLILR
jgi:hypothetical protein